MKGLYIVLEGVDSNGKSTQIKLIEKELSKRYAVFRTEEPGGTVVGKQIRGIILDNKNRISDKTEKYLYLANRSDVVDKIREEIGKGRIALVSRCFLSTEAYQGYGGGENVELIRKNNKEATAGLNPDLVIIYDLDVRTALKRKFTQKKLVGADRMESKALAYHERVRKGYHEIVKHYKNNINIKVIDIEGKDIHSVFRETMGIINDFIGKNYKQGKDKKQRTLE